MPNLAEVYNQTADSSYDMLLKQAGDAWTGRTANALQQAFGQQPQQGLPPPPPTQPGMMPPPPGMHGPPGAAPPPMGGQVPPGASQPGGPPPMPMPPMAAGPPGAMPPPPRGMPPPQPVAAPGGPPMQPQMPMGGGPPGMQPGGGQQWNQGGQASGPLDLGTVLQAGFKANPGAPPQVVAAGLRNLLPLMTLQSQQQYRAYMAQLGGERLDQGWERLDETRRRDDLTAENRKLQANFQALRVGAPLPFPELTGEQGVGGAGGQGAGPNMNPKTGQEVVAGQGFTPDQQAPQQPQSKGNRGAARDIADGVEQGLIPPDKLGTYGVKNTVEGLLSRDKFNLSQAQLDWTGAQQQVRSWNTPRMVQYRGLANNINQTVDRLEQLTKQVGFGRFRDLNLLELKAYAAGVKGSQAERELAKQYMIEVTNLKSEFAQIEQGGYAPHESSWQIAREQLNEGDSAKVQLAGLKEIKRAINMRVTAIGQAAGVSDRGNRYTGQGGQQQQPPGPTQFEQRFETGAPAGGGLPPGWSVQEH